MSLSRVSSRGRTSARSSLRGPPGPKHGEPGAARPWRAEGSARALFSTEQLNTRPKKTPSRPSAAGRPCGTPPGGTEQHRNPPSLGPQVRLNPGILQRVLGASRWELEANSPRPASQSRGNRRGKGGGRKNPASAALEAPHLNPRRTRTQLQALAYTLCPAESGSELPHLWGSHSSERGVGSPRMPLPKARGQAGALPPPPRTAHTQAAQTRMDTRVPPSQHTSFEITRKPPPRMPTAAPSACPAHGTLHQPGNGAEGPTAAICEASEAG